eukprot:4500906-Amphidinium_carterae.1
MAWGCFEKGMCHMPMSRTRRQVVVNELGAVCLRGRTLRTSGLARPRLKPVRCIVVVQKTDGDSVRIHVTAQGLIKEDF